MESYPTPRRESVALATAVSVIEQDEPDSLTWEICVVVTGVAEHQVGVIEDSLLGEQEIITKSPGKFVGDRRGVSGVTLLGDGRIALIVDVNGLVAIVSDEREAGHACGH